MTSSSSRSSSTSRRVVWARCLSSSERRAGLLKRPKSSERERKAVFLFGKDEAAREPLIPSRGCFSSFWKSFVRKLMEAVVFAFVRGGYQDGPPLLEASRQSVASTASRWKSCITKSPESRAAMGRERAGNSRSCPVGCVAQSEMVGSVGLADLRSSSKLSTRSLFPIQSRRTVSFSGEVS